MGGCHELLNLCSEIVIKNACYKLLRNLGFHTSVTFSEVCNSFKPHRAYRTKSKWTCGKRPTTDRRLSLSKHNNLDGSIVTQRPRVCQPFIHNAGSQIHSALVS